MPTSTAAEKKSRAFMWWAQSIAAATIRSVVQPVSYKKVASSRLSIRARLNAALPMYTLHERVHRAAVGLAEKNLLVHEVHLW